MDHGTILALGYSAPFATSLNFSDDDDESPSKLSCHVGLLGLRVDQADATWLNDQVGRLNKELEHQVQLANQRVILGQGVKPVQQSVHPNRAGQTGYYKAVCNAVPVPRGASAKLKKSSICKAKQPLIQGGSVRLSGDAQGGADQQTGPLRADQSMARTRGHQARKTAGSPSRHG